MSYIFTLHEKLLGNSVKLVLNLILLTAEYSDGALFEVYDLFLGTTGQSSVKRLLTGVPLLLELLYKIILKFLVYPYQNKALSSSGTQFHKLKISQTD